MSIAKGNECRDKRVPISERLSDQILVKKIWPAFVVMDFLHCTNISMPCRLRRMPCMCTNFSILKIVYEVKLV